MDKEHIETLIRRDIKALGCDIWGLELIGSIANPTLRVFIDNDKGITVKDCEKVSKHISKVIEADELYSNSLILEVSSPGIDRKFFNKEFLAAEAVMLKIHIDGEAVCGTYYYDVAQTKVSQVIEYSRKNDQPLMSVLREISS